MGAPQATRSIVIAILLLPLTLGSAALSDQPAQGEATVVAVIDEHTLEVELEDGTRYILTLAEPLACEDGPCTLVGEGGPLLLGLEPEVDAHDGSGWIAYLWRSGEPEAGRPAAVGRVVVALPEVGIERQAARAGGDSLSIRELPAAEDATDAARAANEVGNEEVIDPPIEPDSGLELPLDPLTGSPPEPATLPGTATPTPERTSTPTPTPELSSTPTSTPRPACDPSYPDFCIAPPPPDLNCSGIVLRNFRVLEPDPHGFDTDRDGVGCEAEPTAVPSLAPTATAAASTATPTATPVPTARPACDPSYPDVCIAPPPPDLDCGEIVLRNFRVLGPDPHGFDTDGDGVGCEADPTAAATSTRTPTPTGAAAPTQPPTATRTSTPTWTPTRTRTPTPISPTVAPGTCDPSYPDVCIPPPPPDLNCSNIPHKNFRVLQPDPHNFDGNKDGIGCTS